MSAPRGYDLSHGERYREDAAAAAGSHSIWAHRLRHTTATNMLRNGASLPEIGQVLRHQSVDTTAIYAKVDRNSLQTVCRPWPGATLC